MKTLEIKDVLKKDILIVELPEDTQFDVLVDNPLWKDGIKFLTGTDEKFHFIEGSYTLLGKRDEIREEDAKELVEVKDIMEREIGKSILFYKDYKDESKYYFRAVLSLLSAIESRIYWENPYREKVFVNMDISASMVRAANREIYSEKYHEAESRTFDRNRSIILVKN